MRGLICFVLAIISITINAQSGPIDVQRYIFKIGLNDKDDRISGEAQISLVAQQAVSNISLDLTSAKSGKGMTVMNVTAGLKKSKLAFVQEGEKLVVALAAGMRKGDSLDVIIEYAGVPADGLIISKNKYGHRTFFADNWPNRGHNWLPCVDEPADKAAVEFIVTAPLHYQVVANGLQVEETSLPGDMRRTHWREDVPISTKVMVIGVADFAVNLSGTIDGCIPVYSWVYPEDRDKGFYDYAQAGEILPWFIKKVGPYGYRKLANVQSKTIFGGLENANTIFYSENSVNGERKSEDLLVHEIAHQWFGNMATEKSFAHLWLSEGFATFMTIVYTEEKYGKDAAMKMRLKDRGEVIDFAERSPLPVVNETKDYMSLLNANSYQKGGWILYLLREELGDSVFWESIRNYYRTYAGKTADTDDFRMVLEKTSGRDLKPFFKQWLYTPGVPKLNITTKFDAASKAVKVTIAQESSVYQFPLEILDKTTGKTHTIKVSAKTETFSLPGTATSKLVFDPKVSMMYVSNLK